MFDVKKKKKEKCLQILYITTKYFIVGIIYK